MQKWKIFGIFSNDLTVNTLISKWNVIALGAGSQSLSLNKINFAPISILCRCFPFFSYALSLPCAKAVQISLLVNKPHKILIFSGHEMTILHERRRFCLIELTVRVWAFYDVAKFFFEKNVKRRRRWWW